MLTSVADIVDTHTFLARRFRWQWPIDVVGVAEALREAESLAAGRTEDEPAAGEWISVTRGSTLPLILVENLVRKLGTAVRLDPCDREVQVLRMRAVARDPALRATLDDVRAFLNARIRGDWHP